MFSVAGTTFSGALDVELTAATAGAVIRYNLDGSDPQESSPAYSEPVQVDRTLVLKARAYANGALPSRIVEEHYVELEDDVAAFSSDLPIVLVHTMGAQITPEGYIDGVASFVPPGADARARPRDEPAEHARVGLRHRGMSSVYFPKRSFTMELRDESGRDREAPLFGMPADSDWVLYGPYSDKSLLRNYLFYGWSRAIGRYAPRVQFVEAFVHEGTGPISRVDYEGLYAVVERVTVGEERVDIAPLEPEDGAEPEVSGGYLLARDWVDPGEVELTTSMGVPFVIREPDEDDITDAQRQWLLGWLGEMESVLASSRRDDPALGYRQYLDEGSFIDHHLLIEMARNVDGLRLSAFMYKERQGPLHVGPVWDCNTCFG
ncbi:MAG: CotH kinase family protein, partial [Sandaracinaceae bacterium]|nr:CotH kinase family protein [Sandaracinaceae bacterium]